MYHLFNEKQNCGYIFVFDARDRSVEYIERNKAARLGNEFGEVLPFIRTDFSARNLESLGWSHKYGCCDLNYKLCTYSIGNISVVVDLVMGSKTGKLSIMFYFTENTSRGKVKFKLEFNSCASDYISMDKLPNNMSGYAIKLNCPTIMVTWIMTLKDNSDFKGLMESFNNLFGSDIYKIVSNIPSGSISLKSWG